MDTTTLPVAIIGAGPVGLAAATYGGVGDDQLPGGCCG